MDESSIERIIKSIFDRLDHDKSNSLSKAELEYYLKGLPETYDISMLANRLMMSFDLREKDLEWEEFYKWMKNEINVANLRGFSHNLMECLKIPAYEVVLALEDIKTRVSLSDQLKLEWCITQILPSNVDRYQPSLMPLNTDLLEKEAVSNIEEYSPIPYLRLARSDEESSEALINKRLNILNPAPIDLNIHLPASDFDISDFDLNIFDLVKLHGNIVTLNLFAYKAFSHWDIFTSMGFDIQTFLRYTSIIGEGYKPNPYHNIIHAIDVLQASHIFLLKSNMLGLAELNTLHVTALLLSAIVHDYKHPGLNNSYLFLAGDKLAIRYNDSSILENYHIAKAFQVASRDTLNFLCNTSKHEYRTLRKLMIKAVLDTDMSKHTKHISDINTRLYKTGGFNEEKEFIICTFLHMADLSNPCRKHDIGEQWAKLISEEFFAQGDKERENGIEINPLCDRFSVNIAKSQIGFINGVILPYFFPICSKIPGLDFLIDNLKENREFWTEKTEEYQEKLGKS